MYFWNIEALKREIKEDKLTEKDKFLYAFIGITLSTVGLELIPLMPTENINIWDVTNSISNILIVTIGTIQAFKANGGSNGNNFLGKYFSISFVVGIRFMVILIPIIMGLVIYYFMTLIKQIVLLLILCPLYYGQQLYIGVYTNILKR